MHRPAGVSCTFCRSTTTRMHLPGHCVRTRLFDIPLVSLSFPAGHPNRFSEPMWMMLTMQNGHSETLKHQRHQSSDACRLPLFVRRRVWAASIGACIVLITGCSYDGWSMEMNSNSPSPLFGFGFSVDSGSRPDRAKPDAGREMNLRDATIDESVKYPTVVGRFSNRQFDGGRTILPESTDSKTEDVDLRISSF